MVTNCVNCGAPINPHVEKCEYCDSYYSTMSSEYIQKLTIETENLRRELINDACIKRLIGNIYSRSKHPL